MATATTAVSAAMMRSRRPDSTIKVAVTTTSTRATPRALDHHQADQRRRAGQRGEQGPEPGTAGGGAAGLAEDRRDDQDQRDLRELVRLDLEAAGQREPRACAVDHRAERGEHGQQAEHGAAVEERRPGPQLPGVHQADPGHQDQPDRHVEQLLLQVGPGVLARREQAGLGGRPDEQGADRGQPEHHHDQDPVHVPERGVPGERPAEQGPRAAAGEHARPRRGQTARAVARRPAQHHCPLPDWT